MVAAVDLESEDEGVVAVALLGHLGAEVTAEDLEGGPRNVAGHPAVHPFEVAEQVLGGLVGGKRQVDVAGRRRSRGHGGY